MSFQRVTLEFSENKVDPSVCYSDDTVCYANYLLIVMFVTIMQEVYHH
ncbi:hypothetical protein [Wolbachia endosymbiont of Ctenocephalides felis wCfeJ]|nr:hypothetical protein [Wolbachia endosymbiont of Ctenocephalides felis wCfeJ]